MVARRWLLMDTAGRAPQPVRRPRRATLAASTAYLLQLLLDIDKASNEAWLARNGRRLSPELLEAMVDDLADLRQTAVEFARYAASDVGRAGVVGSDVPRRSEREEITTREAASMLNYSERHVRRLLDSGALRGRQVNARQWMVSRASVLAYRQAAV